MEPQTYLSGERLEPMPVPDLRQVFKNYDRFDVGAVGEFDVAVLIDQYAGAAISHNLYPHWRGGYYFAVRPKGDPAASLALLYASRWSTPEKARKFCGDLCRGVKQTILACARCPAGEGKTGGRDRRIGSFDRQANLADRRWPRRHRCAGRHGHGHREPGPGHDGQAGAGNIWNGRSGKIAFLTVAWVVTQSYALLYNHPSFRGDPWHKQKLELLAAAGCIRCPASPKSKRYA